MSNQNARLIEIVKQFSDINYCRQILEQAHWPDGIECPECHSKRFGYIANRRYVRCKDCRRCFNFRTDTLMEDSPLSPQQWLIAFAVMFENQDVTCKTLSKVLGVTIKTAWFLKRKIEIALQQVPNGNTFIHTLKDLLKVEKSLIKQALYGKKQ